MSLSRPPRRLFSAVKHIAPDIPTVFLTVADAVSSGLIASYARPEESRREVRGDV